MILLFLVALTSSTNVNGLFGTFVSKARAHSQVDPCRTAQAFHIFTSIASTSCSTTKAEAMDPFSSSSTLLPLQD